MSSFYLNYRVFFFCMAVGFTWLTLPSIPHTVDLFAGSQGSRDFVQGGKIRSPEVQDSETLGAQNDFSMSGTDVGSILTEKSLIIKYGTIQFIDDIKVPALEAGAIKFLNVSENDPVKKNDMLGKIDDTILGLELATQKKKFELYLKKAEDELAIKAAKKEYELEHEKYKKQRTLRRSKSASESDVKQAEFNRDLAILKTEKAKHDKETAQGDAQIEEYRMKILEERLRRHVIKSDYEGYVVEIFKKRQEFVNVGEEIMRIGRMDELWAHGVYDNKNLNPDEAIHRPVTVTLDMADNQRVVFKSYVESVALESVGGGNLSIRARIRNRRVPNSDTWLLRPFTTVRIEIHLDHGRVNPANFD